MAYNGSVELISGIKPKNGGTFPLVNAHDVQVDDDGTRLDEVLPSSANMRAEEWVFTLMDGSTVTKQVIVVAT